MWRLPTFKSMLKGVRRIFNAWNRNVDTVSPVPRDASWIRWHNWLSEEVKASQPDLIFIGDSITEHWVFAGKNVWAETYARRKAFNLGIGADRIQNVLWRLRNGVIDSIQPKLAIIMVGTNNASTNSAEEIAAGVESVVETVREKLPSTKILLLAIFPRGTDSRDSLRKVNFAANAEIARFADEMVDYLDIGKAFMNEDGTLSSEVMHDGLHLTALGYQIWAKSIEDRVARYLGEAG